MARGFLRPSCKRNRVSDNGSTEKNTVRYNQKVLRRLQLTELDILKDIDTVCRVYDIVYWIDSGTVLGARRHGGFIPWDDDIDIGMPRGDYERFLQVAPAALGNHYCITTPRTNSHQAAFFAKVMLKGTHFTTNETEESGFDQGIFVDVFPYDAVCSNARDAVRQRRRCAMWQGISYLYHSKHVVVPHRGMLGTLEHIICGIAHIVFRALFTSDYIARNFDSAATIANGDAATKEIMISAYASLEPYRVSMLLPPSEIMFEGHSFFAPADVDGYLRKLYGDTWNQLPPEEQRRNHAPKMLEFGSSAHSEG